MTRPAFARDFPEDEALDALVLAFARGDYARVRRDAPKLATETDDESVRRAARLLRERVEADPVAKILLGLTLLLLVVLSGWWMAHGDPKLRAPETSQPVIERITDR